MNEKAKYRATSAIGTLIFLVGSIWTQNSIAITLPMSLREMLAKADHVVLCRVLSVKVREAAEGAVLHAETTIKVRAFSSNGFAA